jgi:hypothetical protein
MGSEPKVNRAVFGGQFEKSTKPRPRSTRRSIPTGKELLARVQSGQYKPAPTEYIAAVRQKVSENCEELLEMGARIRPLMNGNKQVGWVRGVHGSERKQLKRWIKDPDDFILNMILLGTSYKPEEIANMSSTEVYELIEIIRKMTEYDISLTPYISAFTTTQVSENLWFSKGVKITNYENRMVTMPDGKVVRIQAPPDQVRLWASLCTYREQAKKRLDENWNALLIIRPQTGKAAEPVATDLKRIARALETDSIDPWSRIVKNEDKKLDDGWAHGGGSSVEELKREMDAMIKGDKHEKVMDAWEKQMAIEEEERLKKLDEIRKQRNTTGRAGVVDERVEYFTEAEMRERQAALKAGKLPPVKERVKERERRETFETNVSKLRKYR